MGATLRAALAAIVGEAHVGPPAAVVDIAGRACGPFRRVRPGSVDEVAAVVQACRRHRAPVVPLGAATAYWAPLPDTEAVAVDLVRLDAVGWEGQVAVVGAGAQVRPLDQALRARGGHLALHPDAFGATSLGALVASACTSGIGMGAATIGEVVAGGVVVTGRG